MATNLFITKGKPHTHQVVWAQDRGDRCYENKRGWYWHRLDAKSAIVEDSVTGPFDDSGAAMNNLIDLLDFSTS